MIGLFGEGGVHSHSDHMYAILESSSKKEVMEPLLHVITDGRDTPPESGMRFATGLEEYLAAIPASRPP